MVCLIKKGKKLKTRTFLVLTLVVLFGILILNCQQKETTSTLSYTLHTIKDSTTIASTKTTCIVDFSYPIFSGDQPIVDSLNSFIHKFISTDLQGDTYPSAQELSTHLINEYNSFAREAPENLNSWDYISHCKVIYKDGNVISLNCDYYTYTGGAHGIYSVVFISFDKKTAQPLTLKDILKENSRDKLVKIAEDIFRKAQKITADQSFEEQGFWFENDTFYLPGNFAFTETGLLFFFNQYEIASYAAGTFEVTVPFEKINSLLLAPFGN